MQFLLTAVNAKYIHSNPAIYSLRAYAGERLRPFVGIAEYTINQRMEEILGDLYRRQPDVIGFSCYIWNWSLIAELLEEIPKILPHTDLWLGGPEVSFESEELLQDFPMVKGIMAGEGEETFRELLDFYVKKEQDGSREGFSGLERIAGLVLREGMTPGRELTDLNRLPFFYAGQVQCGESDQGVLPAEAAGCGNSVICVQKTEDNLQKFENRILYYETGRGCPFRCSYCLSSVDKRVRLKNMDTVKRELQFFLDHRVPQVKLIDRTFNCNHRHSMEIWQYIKDCDNSVTNFHFEIAADILTEEEISLLQSMRPGLVQLEIGVQSVNPVTLREINRPGDFSRLQRNVEKLRRNNNVHIHLDLIAGLPFEDYKSFGRSFDAVYAMKPHQLQLGFLKVLKGTLIRERADCYGIVYQSRPPYEVLYTKWLSYGEIRRLKGIEEMVELYYNAGQFTRTLPVLEKEFTGAFALFEKLAAYYERKGYAAASPARGRRYQLLLEFIAEELPQREELYRELLTCDYYLRENAKSRPLFCPDISAYRERIWEFYQKEEREPYLLKDYSQYHARQTMKMTHMDVFFYPVWVEGQVSFEKNHRPALVLFDYRKRDVITGNAAVFKEDF